MSNCYRRPGVFRDYPGYPYWDVARREKIRPVAFPPRHQARQPGMEWPMEPKVTDYAASKGAIVSFTRTQALSLADRGIRVNAVAPGPTWTPLTVSSYPPGQAAVFGTGAPLGRRPAQPFEIAPAYVYLASREATYVTGQVLHVNPLFVGRRKKITFAAGKGYLCLNFL